MSDQQNIDETMDDAPVKRRVTSAYYALRARTSSSKSSSPAVELIVIGGEIIDLVVIIVLIDLYQMSLPEALAQRINTTVEQEFGSKPRLQHDHYCDSNPGGGPRIRP